MSWDAIMSNAARDIVRQAGGTGQVTYRGGAGDILVDGYVKQVGALLTAGVVSVGEARWMVVLRVAQVGEPQANDEVTETDGTEWVLVTKDELRSDAYLTVWNVRRK